MSNIVKEILIDEEGHEYYPEEDKVISGEEIITSFKDDTIKSFTFYENGDVEFSPYAIVKSSDSLLPGYYNISYDNYKDIYKIKRDPITECPKPFKFANKDTLDKYLSIFTNPSVKQTLSKLNILNKGGILFYGKEGTGKSTICKYYCKQLVEQHGAMVFTLQTDNLRTCWKFLMQLKRIHKDTLFIVMFEEVDSVLDILGSQGEEYLKVMLDGNMSMDNILVFATTNYIDKIPEALKNRPSRFKYTFEIGNLSNKESVTEIVNNILQDFECDKEAIINHCLNKTLDYVQQYCLDIILGLEHPKSPTKKISL